MSRLEIYRKEPAVAVHVPCSSKQMKKDGYFETIARACSEEVMPELAGEAKWRVSKEG